MAKLTDMTPADESLAASLGVKAGEYKKVYQALERKPTYAEAGIFSAMFSEHCSYKSSKRFLRRFPTKGPQVLQGPGENAGIVDIGDGWGIAFKMESHNHPSFIEPYQGAATGVGGILRDVFTMGARPIAAMNSLCFGAIDFEDTPRVSHGVVKGIGDYGNNFGVPTVAGQTYFHRCYNGNPLVNAFTAGLIHKDSIFRGYASGIGNLVVYVGAKTGRDGVHGATMASQEFSTEKELDRPAVQVGDPFTEKLLLEACLEVMKAQLVVGIQDMGAAGITSSSFEMAHRAGTGLFLDLDKIPTRESGMSAYELLLSESQERMLLVCTPENFDKLQATYEKWDLHAVIVGEVTSGNRVRMNYQGNQVVDVPVELVAEPIEADLKLADIKDHKNWDYDNSVVSQMSLQNKFQLLMEDANFASAQPITNQYDSMVGNRTEGGTLDDAAVLQLRDLGELKKRIVFSVDCNPSVCFLWPMEGGRRAVAECALNIAARGARPLAMTDCLNFGNPENPEVLRQFEQAVEGISEACEKLDTPIVSGNVSLYNDTDGVPIYPTPMIAGVGLITNDRRLPESHIQRPDQKLAILGELNGDIGGSTLLSVILKKEAGRPSQTDLSATKKVIETLVQLQSGSDVHFGAHDISNGGLCTSVVEAAFGSDVGIKISIQDELQTDSFLFGEGGSRVLLWFAPESEVEIQTVARACGTQLTVVGESTASGRLQIECNDEILLDESISNIESRWKQRWDHLF